MTAGFEQEIADRARILYRAASQELWISTNKLFLWMLPLQLLGCALIGLIIGPRVWDGTNLDPRIGQVLLAGAIIAAYPIYMVATAPAKRPTIYAVAVAQMMIGVLLIHLTGGRIESHFHVFGSLAFLAFYRDRYVLVAASAIVVADHAVRGILVPVSVFGVGGLDILRVLEHGGWVLFEDLFLFKLIGELHAGQLRIARRQAELEFTNAAIEKSREELRQSNTELAAARDKALEAMHAKTRFLASMSHEIRTPMNGVLGMLTLLRQTELTAEQEDYAETAQRSGEGLLYLLDEILDFSKLEANKMVIERVPFDLKMVVEDIGDLLSPRAAPKFVDFVVDYKAGIPRRVIGDPNRVRQVLLNLVGNALKFTERGHVAVLVSGDVQDRTATFRIGVEDTGIGISAEQLEHIFDEFTQADASTTRKFGGTGLGLAITRQIVHRMNGSLDVVSTQGVGSTFTFTVPMELDSSPVATEAAPANLSNLHVLFVDDNEVNRRVLADQLKYRGIRVTTAEDGREALVVMRKMADQGDPFPVVILDYLMPETDGLMLGREIKRDPLLCHSRLLALTSSGVPEDEGNFREAGFSGYFAKPIRVELLLDALNTIWLAEEAPCGVRMLTRYSFGPRAAGKISLPPVRERRKGTVLLVEDNAVSRKVGEYLLQRLGFEVVAAGDGATAVELVRNGRFNAVLMDCAMPVMDGYEASRRIRKLPGPAGSIPIIALTANVMSDDRERCFQAGMNEFLPKPLDLERLRIAVESWANADVKA